MCDRGSLATNSAQSPLQWVPCSYPGPRAAFVLHQQQTRADSLAVVRMRFCCPNVSDVSWAGGDVSCT